MAVMSLSIASALKSRVDAYLEQDLQAHCNGRNGCNEQSTDDDSSVPGLEIKGRRIWSLGFEELSGLELKGLRLKGVRN